MVIAVLPCVEGRAGKPAAHHRNGTRYCAGAFFNALADFSAIGFGPFAVDGRVGRGLRPDMEAIAADFRVLGSAIPIIAEFEGTQKLQAAVEESGTGLPI